MTTRKTYEQLLDSKALKNLKHLLNKQIDAFYTPALSYSDGRFKAMSFSVRPPSDKLWFNFTNEWKETPNDSSYYKLSVEKADTPDGITVEGNNLLHPVSSVRVGDRFNVARIEVHGKEEAWNDDDVFFDSAIIITSEDGRRWCLYALDSIADQIVLTMEEAAIKRALEGCELRLELS